jgi:hypothetical protein
MDQYKKSEDLDIYEMDFSHNAHLQEVCDIRQPVLFDFRPIHPKFFHDISPIQIAKYGSYDVKIKDAHDYYKDHRIEHSHVDAVALSLSSSMKLLENDNASHFFSENNDEFLEESGLLKSLKTLDDFLKPSFNVHSQYDLMFGSRGAVTPLRYHTDYRHFISVSSGRIRVKMTPWKSSKYLHSMKDYETYEFRSAVHPIHPQPEYAIDFDKTKFLEFDVLAGYVLYVPPYWWYSIQYLDDPNTFVCGISYNTMMNCVSNIWDLTIYWLQQQNITKKITKIPSPLVEVPPLSSPPVQQSQLSPASPLVDNTQTQTQTQPISAEMLQIPVTNVNQIPVELVQPPALETKPVEVSNSVLPPPPSPENAIVQDTTVVQETIAVHEKVEDPVSTVIPENVTTSLSL